MGGGRMVGRVLVRLIILSNTNDENGESDGCASNVSPVAAITNWAVQLNSPKLGRRQRQEERRAYTKKLMFKMPDPDPHFCASFNSSYEQTEASPGKVLEFLNSPFTPPKPASVTQDSNVICFDGEQGVTFWKPSLHRGSHSDPGPAPEVVLDTPRSLKKTVKFKEDELPRGPALPPRSKTVHFADELPRSPKLQPKAIRTQNEPSIDRQFRPRSLDRDKLSTFPHLPSEWFSGQDSPAESSGSSTIVYETGNGIRNLVTEQSSDHSSIYDAIGLGDARLDKTETETGSEPEKQNGAAVTMQGNGLTYEGKGKGKEVVRENGAAKKVPNIVVTSA
ncbi:hypothetical protein M434DRAFT_31364 [Hypoxylon sp. CO27-5]|nr:hypothetical protein M434DRAFT_31364 [Hypoxylon sp. CO27-5]